MAIGTKAPRSSEVVATYDSRRLVSGPRLTRLAFKFDGQVVRVTVGGARARDQVAPSLRRMLPANYSVRTHGSEISIVRDNTKPSSVDRMHEVLDKAGRSIDTTELKEALARALGADLQLSINPAEAAVIEGVRAKLTPAASAFFDDRMDVLGVE